MFQVADAAKLASIRKQINNTLTGEEAQELKAALLALVDELDNSKENFDAEAFAAEVLKLVNKNEEVPEAVANAIAKKFEAIKNSVDKKKELPIEVRNKCIGAMLRCSGRQEVEDSVNRILTQNEVSGFTFGDVIDFAVVENWGDYNPLFKKLHKTFVSKFFYTDEDFKTASLLAKQWDKNSEAEKAIQQVQVTPKRIDTAYIYKRQKMANEDLDEIEEAGNQSNFLRWIGEELDRLIVNSIVMAILIGDDVNTGDERITTFETIGTKNASDAFTAVVNPASAGVVTLKDLRAMVDRMANPFGKDITLCLSKTTLSAVAEFKYSSGGSVLYRSNEEIAKMLGVSDIYVADMLEGVEGLHAIALITDEYWYKEKKAVAVTYPDYSKNALNWMKERNIGGKIHGLLSTAVLKEAQA